VGYRLCCSTQHASSGALTLRFRSDEASRPSGAISTEREAWFHSFKLNEPSVTIRNNLAMTRNKKDMVVDVLGIGCRSKIDHLAAQASTWARNARYYWGFTEDEDFDPSCAISSEERMEEYITTCNSNKPGAAYFGSYHRPSEVGWFCAQRRPGRALGWLQIVYTRDDPPDMLILVDDDTSVVSFDAVFILINILIDCCVMIGH